MVVRVFVVSCGDILYNYDEILVLIFEPFPFCYGCFHNLRMFSEIIVGEFAGPEDGWLFMLKMMYVDRDDNRRGMLQEEVLSFLMRQRDIRNYKDIF